MGFKEDVKSKTGEFFSSTLEMFDKIFRRTTQGLGRKRKPKPTAQRPLPQNPPKELRHWGETLTPEKSPARPAVKPGTNPPARAKTRKGKSKGSRVLRVGLLLVLLLVLAGFLANHFAIIDLAAIPEFPGLGPKQIVQVPIPRKQPVKAPEKPVASPKPSQTAEKASKPSPAPSVPTPPAMSKEEELVKLETPTTVAHSPLGKERIEEKAPSVAAQVLPKPPEDAATQKIQPAPVQTQATVKPAEQVVAPSKPPAPQYPYSVYLGSFKAPEAVKKALSDYQAKGLPAYWARVDLGEKGVWFRFFTGYFRTKEEAEKFISDRNIQGAAPRLTKYANLIGSYGSEKDAEDQRRALVSAGFYPYVVKEANGRSLLYSGAFDRREFAEKEQSALASKGIRSEVLER